MCGVFGIRSPERDVARIAYFGLFALQHRGQESAGIAVSDRGRITALREMGLVSQVFSEEKLRGLRGELAIGHTRYSTTGSTHWANAQPIVHNGRAQDGRARAQRQPDERRRAARGARGTRHPRPLDVRQRDDRGADRARRRAARGSRRARDREARRRLLVRRARGEPTDRVSRPARDAAALPRPARRRLGRGLRDVRARSRRRRLRARGRPRRGGADRRRRREVAAAQCRPTAAARSASSSSSTSLGPTRGSRASRSTPHACGWASGSPRSRPSRPTSCSRSPTRARRRRSASRARPGSRSARG